MDLQFAHTAPSESSVQAGYSCPCGCHPQVTYDRGAAAATDTCCCGNEFAVGTDAESRLTAAPGFVTQTERFAAPWGESIPAVWAIGPSVHATEQEHDHQAEGAHGEHEVSSTGEPATSATDPVCGMTVDSEGARAKGLNSAYEGHDYFFCGKGCKLDFDEDPARYLDSSYTPSM